MGTNRLPNAPRGTSNTVNIGDNANVGPIAVGTGITQTIGYTAAQISVLLEKIRTDYQPKAFDGQSPYVGLAAFQERDADKFFGREILIAELVTRVATCTNSQARAIFVAGPSGSGKSSLVRAGLIPALKKGEVVGSAQWLYETLKPGRAPLDELVRVVSGLANSPDAGDDLRAHALDDPIRLHRWTDIALRDDMSRRAVIVIDQFEEIFTQLSSERETERAAFLNLLTYASSAPNGRTLVLFTLRSDFVTNCASYPNLNALVNQQFLQVGAMTPDELVSAIARPAYQVGLRLDPALISQIVNDVRGEPGALPLMQFALQDLFQVEKQQSELTLDGYLARGGLRKALERHADAEFKKLDDTEKQLARAVFSGLIEIGRGREDTKRTALFGELVPAGVDAARVQALVRELADARLITTDEQEGKETVTLAHERLIDAWDWLRRLVDENRDAIALQNEIAQDAQEWETQKRDESYLYRGARLVTAQEKLQQNKLVLNGLAEEFVQAGIAARDKERRTQQQRTRTVIGGLAAAVLILGVLGGLAVVLWQQAIALQSISRSRELAAVAVDQLNEDPERALLIALASNKEATTLESEDALRQTLVSSHLIATLPVMDAFLSHAQFSPGGSEIVTVGCEKYENNTCTAGAARLWDVATLKELIALRGHEGSIYEATFAPDGTKLVTGGLDSTARLWDVKTGKQLAVLDGNQSGITTAKFSSDGKSILTLGCYNYSNYLCKAGVVGIWDGFDGRKLGELQGLVNQFYDANFSPDGSKIITAECTKYENYICTAGVARIWDAATAKELSTLPGRPALVSTASFSPDGSKIVTAECTKYENYICMAGVAHILDSASAGEIAVLIGHTGLITLAKFSPDGARLLTAGCDHYGNHECADGVVRIWNASDGTQLATLTGHEDPIYDANFSPDGTQVVTAAFDTLVRLWDSTTGKQLAILRGHTGPVLTAQFSPDGQKIVTTSDDRTVRLWVSTVGKEVAIGHTTPSLSKSSQLSHDGSKIVVAECEKSEGFKCMRPLARILDAKSHTQLATLFGHQDHIITVSFSPNDARVVTAGYDNTARIWDAITGDQLAVLRGHEELVGVAQFSPDNNKVVTAGYDNTARIWDAITGDLRAILRGHTRPIYNAKFSPDSSKIVTASDDQTAMVWDASTGNKLATLRGHANLVRDAEFSPDSKTIVTASYDQTARVWDVTTGNQLAILYGNTNAVYSAHFSNDGRTIESMTEGGATRTYLVHIQDLIELAKTRVTRELRCDERVTYLHENIACPTPAPAPFFPTRVR